MSRTRHKPTLLIRLATAADLPEIKTLLETSLLPVADLSDDLMAGFQLAESDGLIGVVGLEGGGKARLLRSMAVAERAQGQGLGHRLLQAAETLASEQGAETIYLLTTTAEPFFARAGYLRVPRESAPAGLKLLAEFSNLCPSTAACMSKRLA